MYIEMVPDIPNTKVVNRKIVYSDTANEINENTNNLQVYSISEVTKYSLDACIKIILESNPDAVFDTIQYSISESKVYFYTDRPISTKVWEDRKNRPVRSFESNQDVLREIMAVLGQEGNMDSDCISLYNIALLAKKYESECGSIMEKMERKCNRILEEKKKRIRVDSFDYERNRLYIGYDHEVSEHTFFNYDIIVLEKKDGDLYVVSSESQYYQEVLRLIGLDLSSSVDELLRFHSYKNSRDNSIKSFNSSFLISIDSTSVSINAKLPDDGFIKKFSMSSSNRKPEYSYNCNSTLVLSAIQGKDDEIFKRIFVRIDDCPDWCKDELYQMRQEELAAIRKSEEERLEAERRIEQERLEAERREEAARLEREKNDARIQAIKRKLMFWVE